MNLPSLWQKTELGEVLLSIVGGGTPSKSNPSFYEGNIPWMSVKDMNKNILNDTVDHISQEAVDNSSTNIIPAGTPIIATRMSLGKIVVANFDSAINQDLKALFPATGINRDYLIAWYRSIARKIEELGTGTTVKGVRLEVLNSLEFPLPSFAEQKIIADKLDILLAQVESTKSRLERIPQILKTFRQSVLAAAVSGKLTEEWRGQSNYCEISLNLEKSYKSISVPNNWLISRLCDSCKVVSGNAFKSGDFLNEGHVPVIKISNVQYGKFEIKNQQFLPSEYIETYHDFAVCDGDLLMALTRPITNDTLKVCRYPASQPVGLLNQRVAKFVFRNNSEKAFFELLFQSDYFKVQVIDKLSETLQPNLSPVDLKNFIVAIPDESEQTEIVRRVETLFAFADSIEQKANAALARVNNLTQSILAKAFRGELTADWRAANPDLITGENSAAALLEKIKAEREAMQPKKKTKTKA